MSHSDTASQPNDPNKTDKAERVYIFDTTLRDGEQSPGCSMNREEKLQIATVLDEMGVDIIEAGFPVASKGDFECVNDIAKTVKNATVCGLARAVHKDIEACAEAIKPAQSRRIHTFISTSPLHMKHKLQMDEDTVIEAIRDSVSFARGFTDDVEWSAEDGSRTEDDFLCRAVETAIKAGARTINVPDTVGYATPDDYSALIAMLVNRVPNIDEAILSVHCHNDLGLAVANSLAGVNAGARQIECTINGIGERAGNAAMEEIIMAMRTRQNQYPYRNNIKTEMIIKASKTLSKITGFNVQPNKAIVGANAFAHESGIHQDGMLKHRGTYEIMTPESVGLIESNLVLGKHSGRHAFRAKLDDLGYTLSDDALNDAFARFKDLADQKKEIFDDDIIALMDDKTRLDSAHNIDFVDLLVHAGTDGPQTAKITLRINDEEKTAQASGNGPVDAMFKAIREIYPHDDTLLLLYNVHAVTGGIDAQAEVTVRLEQNGHIVNGKGAHVDTMIASAKAYIHALNKMSALNAMASISAEDRALKREVGP